eukprot:jgi/Botrbrau1/17445/Bobra.0054s0034.1
MAKGLIPSKNMRGRSRHSRKQRMQGGGDWGKGAKDSALAGLGAVEIPAFARERGQASALHKAHAALALTAAPGLLPCRETERAHISRFVQDAVLAGERCEGQCLYVSGVPGTGKTATVLGIMRALRTQMEQGSFPHFQFVEINALRLPSPYHAYVQLHEALTGYHLGPQKSLAALEEIFSAGAGRTPPPG